MHDNKALYWVCYKQLSYSKSTLFVLYKIFAFQGKIGNQCNLNIQINSQEVVDRDKFEKVKKIIWNKCKNIELQQNISQQMIRQTKIEEILKLPLNYLFLQNGLITRLVYVQFRLTFLFQCLGSSDNILQSRLSSYYRGNTVIVCNQSISQHVWVQILVLALTLFWLWKYCYYWYGRGLQNSSNMCQAQIQDCSNFERETMILC
eukprot:TRINITY_DN3792_c0_g1_i6.p2 TRINITY_DN3792_c0_g1~~TRINITY_DN3792_c0_g1_i6.p2  ORF type:complete len:204 (-),score=-13.19 TRINITY_DN3792_c0_g1_i6:186-797(-)